jgi:biotin carboxyl carrier protein
LSREYEIEVGGRTRKVSVSRAGEAFAVTVDGRTTLVDVARIDGQTLSLILDNARSKDALVTAGPAAGDLTVTVDGTQVPVVLNGRRRHRRDGAKGSGSDRPEKLTAPMPGKIVRVLVKAGDKVVARQPLVVVEAMKMENELRSGRDGVVAEVHASEGQSVDRGALLVVIQ